MNLSEKEVSVLGYYYHNAHRAFSINEVYNALGLDRGDERQVARRLETVVFIEEKGSSKDARRYMITPDGTEEYESVRR